MAITIDSINAGSNQTGSALSFSHTCSGTQRILFMSIINIAANTDDLTSVTYAGIPMTLIGQALEPVNLRWTYLYYVIAPATGANNITVNSVSSTQKVMNAISYNGARQLTVPDASTIGTSAGNSITGTVTTIADNCWLVGLLGAVGTALTGTGITTLRGTVSSFNKMMDSNGPISPAASASLGATTTATGGIVLVMCSFAATTSQGNFSNISTITNVNTVTI